MPSRRFTAETRRGNPEMVHWCANLAAAEMLLSGTAAVADGYFLEDSVARLRRDRAALRGSPRGNRFSGARVWNLAAG